MDSAKALKAARTRSGMSQAELARLARTSQPTISDYERGIKEPALSTLDRLLSVLGGELEAHAGHGAGDRAALAQRGRHLAEVLALAEALPARARGGLRYPTLHTLAPGAPPSPS